jgi:hypothetical protein
MLRGIDISIPYRVVQRLVWKVFGSKSSQVPSASWHGPFGQDTDDWIDARLVWLRDNEYVLIEVYDDMTAHGRHACEKLLSIRYMYLTFHNPL